MDYFQKFEVKKSDSKSDEFVLFLHFNENITEFADELGKERNVRTDIVTSARQILKERYPRLKVTMVKVLLGGIVVASIPLTVNTASAAEPNGSNSSTTQQSEASSTTYLVKVGDTLWSISNKFNTSVEQIKKVNNLSSDTVSVNQRLLIPQKTHTVVAGDTLWSIASKYGTSVSALRSANNLTSDIVSLGQTLLVPSVNTSTSIQPSNSSNDAQSAATTTHTVTSGETLWSIATRYGTSVTTLRTANNLSSDVLSIGQKLMVPAGTPVQPTTSVQTSASTHTVSSGDTLWSIATQYGISVSALKAANQLTSDILSIGQTLTIPANNTGNTSQPTANEKAPTTNPTTHTVALGDTLWSIASRYGTSVSVLKNANNLPSDILSLGQTITIPSSNSETRQEPTVEQERATFIYSVRSGDTLSVIAKRFGVTVDSIRSANQLRSDILSIGQALTIPDGINAPAQTGANTITYITHTVKSGDTMWDLSVRYGIPQSELLRANNLTSNSMLSIGQKLTIPVHNVAVKPVVSEKHGEYLDWWTEAQYVFTIGKIVKVTDLDTGKSFYIKRNIGANHADSETVTTNDSNIAKSIWGGYSWKPRAVVLEIDGRKIAASMSFMPHEREYITNNGITGHFDVYFGNSTRHVDGKADASHQAQVERAAGIR